MSLNELLLPKLAEWRPAALQTLTVAEGGWNAAVSADRCDELGCLVWEVTCNRTAPAETDTPLRAWAERLAARATGLLENLQLLEVDPLRSQTGLSRAEIIDRLKATFTNLYGATPGDITPEEYAAAEKLVAEKFGTDAWLYRVP